MRQVLIAVVTGMLLFTIGAARALAPVPSPTGYVTDETQMIEPAEMAKTQVLLGEYEVTTGRKISVLMVVETPDEELEAYADRVLAQWKMDSTDRGGALLLWSADGYILIRVAGPMGERLNGDAQSDILSRWVVPAFARGEAGVGIRQGAERMIAVLDGGEVGFPPAVPGAEEGPIADAAAALEMAAEAARSAESPPLDETDADAVARIDLETPAEMPPWIQKLPGDLARLTGGFSQGVLSGLGAWLGEAGDQLSPASRLIPSVLLQQDTSEDGQSTVSADEQTAVYFFAGALVLAAVMLWGRAFVLALMVAGLGGGIALGFATGFTALAAVMMLIGLLSPVLVPILRAVLRGANDSEREPMPTICPQKPMQTRTMMATPRTTARAAAAATRQIPRGNPSMPYSLSKRDEKVEELKGLIASIARSRIRQLKPVHGIVALVLAFGALPLLILGLLGLAVVLAYRDGVAYLLADLLVAEPGTRERLKSQLPKPITGSAAGP